MKPGIVVVMEQRGGEIKRSSLEALAEGVRLKATVGGDVVAAVIGKNAGESAATITGQGADRIVAIARDDLEHFATESYGRAAMQVIEAADPGVVLLAATAQGRDLGAALAGRLDTAYAAEAIAISAEGDQLHVRRPVYAGKAIATVSAKAEPFVISLRPNVFPVEVPDGAGEAPVEVQEPGFAADEIRARVTGISASDKGAIDVAEADTVVSGGRGVGSPEGFAPLEKLAEVLGAAVGASRAVVDLGWRPHAEQVGQTGKVVSPKLYFAIGISGAIQHLAGMRTSKVIVAVNKDPEAPIFKVADYGIVGDLFEVVPALTERLAAELGKN